MQTRYTRQQGFSLIEVMIAVTILAVGLLALAGFNGKLYQNVSHSADRSRAQTAAQQVIDMARTLGTSAGESASAFSTRLDSNLTHGAADCSSSALRTYWIVTLADATSGLKHISANVCWTDAQNQLQTLAFSTYVGALSVAAAATIAPAATPTPIPTATPVGSPAWSPSATYAQNAKVSDGGNTYQCTKAAGCAPPADPSWTPAVAWWDWAKI